MRIAVLTFEGFNELDSFVAAGLLNRMRGQGWQAQITAPSEWITSMNGVRVQAQQPLEFANAADVVLFLTTKPWVIEAGVQVLDQPFFANGNLATAGGCLSAPYLAAWVIAKLAGEDACATALHYVAPVGEKEAYMAHALGVVRPYL
ncbi:hypothetical protein D3C85_1492410 [compost metagenome]